MLAVTYCLQNSIQGTSGKGSVCVYVCVCVTDPEAKNQACLCVSGCVSLFMPVHLPCYGLNVCIPPKFLCGDPLTKDNFIRWVFGKCVGQEGGTLMNGISAPEERPQRAPWSWPTCEGPARTHGL